VSRAVVADRLRDGQNVHFVETASRRSASVPAGSKPYHLFRIIRVWVTLEVIALEVGGIDQYLSRRRAASEGRDARKLGYLQRTGQGFTSQMSDAYFAMVRSLENLPKPPRLKMALRAHALTFAVLN
jgi:hypothetical protein